MTGRGEDSEATRSDGQPLTLALRVPTPSVTPLSRRYYESELTPVTAASAIDPVSVSPILRESAVCRFGLF